MIHCPPPHESDRHSSQREFFAESVEEKDRICLYLRIGVFLGVLYSESF
jgi:hypothetical protein